MYADVEAFFSNGRSTADSEQQKLFKTELLRIKYSSGAEQPIKLPKSVKVDKNALPLQNFKNSKVFRTLLRR